MLGQPRNCRFCYHRGVWLRPPLIVALTIANCSSPRQVAEDEWIPAPPPDLGDTVARIGRVPIFTKQVQAEAKRTGKTVRAALNDLIAINLLAEHARQQGFALVESTDPDVQSALVQRLIERDLEPNLRPTSTPDSALRPLWERARESFVHPRLVEIGVLAVYTGALMKKDERETREHAAQALAVFLHSHPARTLDEFVAVARDPVWSARKVVFNRLLQSPDKPLSKKVGAEVAKLRAPDDTTPLIIDENGGFIARYIGERPPEDITFEQARGKLLAGFYEQWSRQEFLNFTARLMTLHRIETHFDRLSTNENGL